MQCGFCGVCYSDLGRCESVYFWMLRFKFQVGWFCSEMGGSILQSKLRYVHGVLGLLYCARFGLVIAGGGSLVDKAGWRA